MYRGAGGLAGHKVKTNKAESQLKARLIGHIKIEKEETGNPTERPLPDASSVISPQIYNFHSCKLVPAPHTRI